MRLPTHSETSQQLGIALHMQQCSPVINNVAASRLPAASAGEMWSYTALTSTLMLALTAEREGEIFACSRGRRHGSFNRGFESSKGVLSTQHRGVVV